MCENIMEQNTGRVIYEAGLITTFNAQSIEQVGYTFIFYLFNKLIIS